VPELIGSECSVVYTNTVSHVGPIVMALCDHGAIGYYGKMRESEAYH